jgi:hypothetical protein
MAANSTASAGGDPLARGEELVKGIVETPMRPRIKTRFFKIIKSMLRVYTYDTKTQSKQFYSEAGEFRKDFQTTKEG